MKLEKPSGLYCYKSSVFGDEVNTSCPNLDERIVMSPKCNEFSAELHWNVSGRVLKCKECRVQEFYSHSQKQDEGLP
jgi:hypothetical protein